MYKWSVTCFFAGFSGVWSAINAYWVVNALKCLVYKPGRISKGAFQWN